MIKQICCLSALLSAALWFSSCRTITQQGSDGVIETTAEEEFGGTGTSSSDIKAMAERMAREIVGIHWPKAGVTPTIALLPTENHTRFRVDPKLLQNKLVRDLVNFAAGRVMFLARDNEQDILRERAKKRSGFYEKGNTGSLAGADYFIKSEMRSLSKASRQGVSDYIVYTFQLIDAETGGILWTNDYETKKIGTVGVSYQ